MNKPALLSRSSAPASTKPTVTPLIRAFRVTTALALFTTVVVLAFAGAASAQRFTDVSDAAGLHRDLTRAWGNPLWGDLNNDGLLDLLVPNHEAPSGVLEGGIYPYIYLNNGNGTFTDVSATSGVVEQEPDTGAWQGISLGDYDGDGNLDIFISEPPYQGGTDTTRNLLFKGNGDGTWEYVSASAGIIIARHYGECSFFVDYDNDGKLDLFVKNFPNRVGEIAENLLYRNNGDGTFSVIPGAGGLADATRGATQGIICSFADYDNDGFMDVAFSGNDSPEALYHNNRDGTFSEVTDSSGLTPQSDSQGLAWGDYDNDGLLDLYVSRGSISGKGFLSNTLYHNNGNGTFSDVTTGSKTDDGTSTFAAVWGDYDNDGFLDLFVARPGAGVIGPGNANLLYHNNGDGTFTDVAAQEGVALENGETTSAHKLAAWGDYNGDGYLDLCVKDGIGPGLATGNANIGKHFLFKNSGGANHHLKLYLRGVQSNLNGIGARVAVTYEGGLAYRENNGGGGGEWGSQGANPLHFGIGSAETATIRITWPSGIVDILPSVDANSFLTVVEGSNPPTAISQNISTRLLVQSGENVGIGGFIITGTTVKKVLVRGIGPSLEAAGVTNFLADPALELHRPDGVVTTNDNWRDADESEITATGLAPTNDAEAAIVATLTPGAYTAVIRGQNGTTGVGLVEVYDLDLGVASQLANVSTRGFVGAGNDVMIGGVIIGPNGASNSTLVVRALGPALGNAGVVGSLADPTLEVHDANGAIVAFNDNWQDDAAQAALIAGAGFAPSDSLESALYLSLGTGNYTAVVRGKDDTTGVSLVEVYNLN